MCIVLCLHMVTGGYVYCVVSAHGGRKFGVSYISYMMMKCLVCHAVSLYLWDNRLIHHGVSLYIATEETSCALWKLDCASVLVQSFNT